MSTRSRLGHDLGMLIAHALLFLSVLAALLPLIWMLSTSLKTLPQVFEYPPRLLPDPIVWQNYPNAVQRLPFGLYLRNTMIVASLSVAGTLLSCSVIAYAFAKLRFPGRDMLFILVLSTLMLPDMVRLVPTFLLFKEFGWINTLYPLVVPTFFGHAFYIFLLRQFFMGIPNDLIDAARIDGASEWGILARIVLPLSKPALMVVAIFAFQFAWNDFMWPLVFLTEDKVKTLTLGLYSFRSMPTFGTAYNELMAAATLVTLPMVILFALFQKYFLKGISLGGSGVKG